MPTLSESRLLRFVTFGILYFAQGVPWGFVSVAYLTYLTDRGLSNTAVGAALGVAYLPWSFKVLWGPVIDRFSSVRFGRRRPFIIGSELLMGLTMLLMAPLFATGDLGLISNLVFLNNTFAALQDVSVDALAVDLLPDRERARANGIMWACKVGGSMVGGGGSMFLVKRVGWSPILIGMTVLLWGIMVFVMLLRERPAGEDAAEAVARARTEGGAGLFAWLKRVAVEWHLKDLWHSFAFPTALAAVAIALFTPIGYSLTSPVFTRMLRADLKLSEEMIGLLNSVVPNASGVVGALIGGYFADKVGKRKVIAVFMTLIAAAMAVFALVPQHWSSLRFLTVWVVVFQMSITAYSAATLGFFMTLSNPVVGATNFALYMAATNLTYRFTAEAGGFLADKYGIAAVYGIAAAIQLGTIALLPLCDPRVAEERFRRSVSREIPLPEVGGSPGA
ncbi:MAG: MFS transporter [Polyangiaceae bacterium]|nr:MFS transporter [Polyangiaceae bacterium]NUQ74641.1 MFS transporter [Polyangiaceae bacterium]